MSSSQGSVVELRVPFPTRRLANLVCDALAVDPEPPKAASTKTLSVIDQNLGSGKGQGVVLRVVFKSLSGRVKPLRVALSNFTELLLVTLDTIKEFDKSPQ